MAKRTFTLPNSLVTRSLDGDTHDVDANWEQPFNVRPAVYPIRLRIRGIDCYGKTQNIQGAEAYVRARELVEGRRYAIQTYESYAYGAPDGTVGEWVGDILVPNPDPLVHGSVELVFLSGILLREGLALPYDGKGKRPSARA